MTTKDTVTLYTRQHENSLYELKNKGRITNKELYVRLHMGDISDFFLERYNIFVKMAEQIIPRSNEIQYPIWCSISKKSCLRPIEKELVYVLEVPRDQVIYFDGGKWDYVLNDLYIPKDDADKADFEKEIAALGVRDQFNFITGRYKGMYPHIEKKIKDSWVRIFEIDEWNEYLVQANLWEIKEEWVVRIVGPGEVL